MLKICSTTRHDMPHGALHIAQADGLSEHEQTSCARMLAREPEEVLAVKLTKIVKWRESQTANCPAIYRADNGDLVVQGWKIDGDTRANLDDVLVGEDAVRIPANLIEDFMREAS
jgi:hypothetical protein